MKHLVQTSQMEDHNNCTVLALKSVTGWSEKKCYGIMKSLGRVDNRGFNVFDAIVNANGKIGSIKLMPVYLNNTYISRWREYPYSQWEEENEMPLNFRGTPWELAVSDWGDDYTIGSFAKTFNKGIYYITTRDHALAIVNGDVIDNVTCEGLRRKVVTAHKVVGKVNPKISKLSVNGAKKTYPRLEHFEKVVYVGKNIKDGRRILLKNGQKVIIYSQNAKKQVRINLKERHSNVTWKITVSREDIETLKTRPTHWNRTSLVYSKTKPKSNK